MAESARVIAIVGPCGSGKSTLVEGLAQTGIHARQIAQEHSYVADMWQIVTEPEILIYLEASFEACTERKGFSWSQADYGRQVKRLNHARRNCDVFCDTTDLDQDSVLESILEQLRPLLGSPEV